MKSEMKTVLVKKFRWALLHGYGLPVFVSVALHCTMLALLMVSWSQSAQQKITPPLHIKASLVEAPRPESKRPVDDGAARRAAEEKARKAKAVAEKRRKQELARKKKEAERQKQLALKREQEAKEKAREEAEQKRKEKERLAQLEARRKKEQAELREQLAREQAAREKEQRQAEQAEKDASEVSYYSALLVNRMKAHWNRPPSARNSMEAVIEIRLSPFGDLQGFIIIKGSGNEAFDRSVIQAIKLGTPIVELKQLDRRIYEKNFRRFTFKFSPEDLVR